MFAIPSLLNLFCGIYPFALELLLPRLGCHSSCWICFASPPSKPNTLEETNELSKPKRTKNKEKPRELLICVFCFRGFLELVVFLGFLFLELLEPTTHFFSFLIPLTHQKQQTTVFCFVFWLQLLRKPKTQGKPKKTKQRKQKKKTP